MRCLKDFDWMVNSGDLDEAAQAVSSRFTLFVQTHVSCTSTQYGNVSHPFLGSLEALEGTCDQKRLWSDCTDVQADLSFHW